MGPFSKQSAHLIRNPWRRPGQTMHICVIICTFIVISCYVGFGRRHAMEAQQGPDRNISNVGKGHLLGKLAGFTPTLRIIADSVAWVSSKSVQRKKIPFTCIGSLRCSCFPHEVRPRDTINQRRDSGTLLDIHVFPDILFICKMPKSRTA